jgi:hypothetical protein
MTDPLEEAKDATPLTLEEHEGLMLSHVTLRSELNVGAAEHLQA